eukprot:TRINITY_DN3379_c0_g1_i8.p1 TRINITY_DN3379_c0_g1~~TRINITY_DN3379_c0_g1_i8.p1  ORF type:complete len:560 (+),score=143.60 TRINITY_DN3379_c0_g1_i8:485-2164(+)
MRRYKWTLAKTMEFLTSRRNDLEIRPSFFYQLTVYERHLAGQGLVTATWNEIAERTSDFENEELLVRNTFLNAQVGPSAALPFGSQDSRVVKLKWIDELKGRYPLVIVVEEPVRGKQRSTKLSTVSILKTNRRAKNGRREIVGRALSQKAKAAEHSHSKENEGSRNAIDIYVDIMKQIEGNKQKLPLDTSNRHLENPHANSKRLPKADYIESQYIRKIQSISDKYPIEGFVDLSADGNARSNAQLQYVKGVECNGQCTENKKVLQSADNKQAGKGAGQEKDLESLWMRFSNYNGPDKEQVPVRAEEKIARPSSISGRCEQSKESPILSKKSKPSSQTFSTNLSDKPSYSPMKNPITKVTAKKVMANVRPSSAKIKRDPVPSKAPQRNDRARNGREQGRLNSSTREKRMMPSESERRILVGHSNIGISKHEGLHNGPLRLVTEQNNALNSFRNGPVKAAFNPGIRTLPKQEAKITSAGALRERQSQAGKGPRHRKYARPASPGIHGKVVEPLYAKTIKSYTLAGKAKLDTTPRQQMLAQVTVKASIPVKGISPARPVWKS